MWRIFRHQKWGFRKWPIGRVWLAVDPWTLIGDALGMTLVVAVAVLATVAYGL